MAAAKTVSASADARHAEACDAAGWSIGLMTPADGMVTWIDRRTDWKRRRATSMDVVRYLKDAVSGETRRLAH